MHLKVENTHTHREGGLVILNLKDNTSLERPRLRVIMVIQLRNSSISKEEDYGTFVDS